MGTGSGTNGMICETAFQKKVGILVDAEETWIQDPVDALTFLMMDAYNRGQIVIYNTIQHYRKDRLKFLIACHNAAEERQFILGAKLGPGCLYRKGKKACGGKRIIRLRYNPTRRAVTGIIMKDWHFVLRTLTASP